MVKQAQPRSVKSVTTPPFEYQVKPNEQWFCISPTAIPLVQVTQIQHATADNPARIQVTVGPVDDPLASEWLEPRQWVVDTSGQIYVQPYNRPLLRIWEFAANPIRPPLPTPTNEETNQ